MFEAARCKQEWQAGGARSFQPCVHPTSQPLLGVRGYDHLWPLMLVVGTWYTVQVALLLLPIHERCLTRSLRRQKGGSFFWQSTSYTPLQHAVIDLENAIVVCTHYHSSGL